MQESVNQAMYKSKYEDAQVRLNLLQEKFNQQMKEKNDFLLKKEQELVELVKKNEEQINKLGA